MANIVNEQSHTGQWTSCSLILLLCPSLHVSTFGLNEWTRSFGNCSWFCHWINSNDLESAKMPFEAIIHLLQTKTVNGWVHQPSFSIWSSLEIFRCSPVDSKKQRTKCEHEELEAVNKPVQSTINHGYCRAYHPPGACPGTVASLCSRRDLFGTLPARTETCHVANKLEKVKQFQELKTGLPTIIGLEPIITNNNGWSNKGIIYQQIMG